MATPKRKPAEAGDGSYAGMVLAAFDDLSEGDACWNCGGSMNSVNDIIARGMVRHCKAAIHPLRDELVGILNIDDAVLVNCKAEITTFTLAMDEFEAALADLYEAVGKARAEVA